MVKYMFVVYFQRQIQPGNTHMPLSSGDPGVMVEPSIVHDHKEHRVKKLLTLGKHAWYLLDWGQNVFYCKATDMDGNSNLAYFVVYKKPYEHQGTFHYRGRKRRNPLYRLRRLSSSHLRIGGQHQPSSS